MSNIKVVLGEYKGIKVPAQKILVSEWEIDAELERARSYAAKTEDKDDAAAEMGDQAIIDFVGYIDDKPFEGGDGTDYPLELGSNTFIPGFEKQLVGAKVGETVDVIVAFPENYHAAEYAGRDAVFKVTVKSLRRKIIPELSDEVVSRISPCKTIAEFREYVRGEITKHRTNEMKQERENQILTIVVEASQVEIPDDEIKERADALKANLEGQLRSSGNTLEQYLDYQNMTLEMFDKMAWQNATDMLRGQSVLLKIASEEGLSFTEEELEQEFYNMARTYQTTVGELKEMIGERGREMVGEDILHAKALDLIVNAAIEE